MFPADIEKRIPKRGGLLPDLTFKFSSSPSPSLSAPSSTPRKSPRPRASPSSSSSSTQKRFLESEILRAFFAQPLPTSPSSSSSSSSSSFPGAVPDLKGKQREQREQETEPQPPSGHSCDCLLHSSGPSSFSPSSPSPSPSSPFPSSSSSCPPSTPSTTSSACSCPSSPSPSTSPSPSPSSESSCDPIPPTFPCDLFLEYEAYEDAERSFDLPPSSSSPFPTIFEEGEFWEARLLNTKRGERYVRSTSQNKEPRINPERYVNSRDQRRKEAQEAFEAETFQAVKLNRQIMLARELSLLNEARRQPFRKGVPAPAHPFSQTRRRSSRRSRSGGAPLHAGGRAQAPGEYVDSRELQRMARQYGVTPQIMEEIQKLQWKPNLTPEDYELLILLDQAIKPKTVSKATVGSFPKRTLAEADFTEGRVEGCCPVCIAPYMIGEVMKTLPCGHGFHSQCIDYWLTNSSTRCPCDGLEVLS